MRTTRTASVREPDGDAEQRRRTSHAERGQRLDATIENLPKYAAGEEIEYTWTEADCRGLQLTDTT